MCSIAWLSRDYVTIMVYSCFLMAATPLFGTSPRLDCAQADVRESTTGQYMVNWLSQVPTTDSRFAQQFQIRSISDGKISTVTLNPSDLDISELFINTISITDRTFAIQSQWKKRPRWATTIDLLDAKNSRFIDEFAGYNPTLSPNKVYWVYIKFFASSLFCVGRR